MKNTMIWIRTNKVNVTESRICGAPTRQQSGKFPKGDPCHRPAGWGTSHLGYGKCKLHGGNMANVALSAVREEVMDEVRRVMGPALDVDPMEALLWCVRIAAGEVAYSTFKVETLEEQDAVGRPTTSVSRTATGGKNNESWEETTFSPVALNLWITVRRESLDRLAKYSKMALDAGIAERSVKLAESAGDSLALAIREILEGLQLSAIQEQKAPELVRGALIKLEQETFEEVEADVVGAERAT